MKRFLTVMTTALCVAVCMAALTACASNGDDIEVADVTLNLNEITLTEGKDYTLTATITPSNATDQSMEWQSSDEKIATVDSGSVYAVSEGTATITVTTANGKTATCVVTVEAAESEPPVQYTVTFYANGGEFEDGKDAYKVQIDHGEKIGASVTPTRGDKYVFTKWYKDEYRNHPWDFDEDTVTDDTNLFAGWEYLNKYQSVTDALEARIKAERNDDAAVEILSVFTDGDGYFCFVEKDGTGAFSYKTDITDYAEVAGNAELISQIPDTTLTQLKAYNGEYTSENNALIADSMAYRYTDAANVNEAIIYSCVSDWELYSEGDYTANGPWYAWQVKAIVADNDGKVYDCTFKVVSGMNDITKVYSGTALSEEVEMVATELGELANDLYSEYLKALNA